MEAGKSVSRLMQWSREAFMERGGLSKEEKGTHFRGGFDCSYHHHQSPPLTECGEQEGGGDKALRRWEI